MSRARWIRRGLVAVIAVALVVASAVAIGRTGDSRHVVTAAFQDASPLVAGNLVKADGVQVGVISSIKLDHGRAMVEMELEPGALPVHDDASASVRAMSLLGERYVELKTGSPNRPAMDLPGEIPESRTSRSVGVEDLLNTLDDPTSAALASLVTTLGEGTAGQGQNIDAALRALEPAMNDTGRLGKVLGEQNAVLASLVDKTAPVTEALASGRGQKLDGLVGSTTTALRSAAEQRVALDATMQRLPETLNKAQQTLAEVGGLSKSGTQTLREVRPVTGNLPQITEELGRFADSADPALASLEPVLQRADQLLDQAEPVVRDLGPGGRALRSVSGSAEPLVNELQPNLTVVLDFMKFWALSTNGRDGVGNYFRGVVADTPQSLLQIPGVGLPGAPEPAPPAQRPGEGPGDPLGGVTGLLPPLPGVAPGAQPPADGSATGLDEQQEQSLVNQLLGGR